MDNKLRVSLVNCVHYKSTLREIVERNVVKLLIIL